MKCNDKYTECDFSSHDGFQNSLKFLRVNRISNAEFQLNTAFHIVNVHSRMGQEI